MSNAIVARKDSLRSLAGYLEGRKSYLAKVLPKHLTAERVVKVAITAASRTPALLNCTPESFALAVIQASQLGLEAGSPLGEAYLVPYKNECTLIVGYRGLIALARRSGEIESIEAHVVHARDRIELSFGLDAQLSHTPHMPTPPATFDEKAMAAWQKDADPGPMIAVYAIARLKGGAVQYEVMTRAQVDAIRARSRASGGPWTTDYEEMARKTVVRRLAKYLPMSIEMAQALDVEDRQDHGETLADIAQDIEIQPAGEVVPGAAAKKSATDKMKEQLAAKKAATSENDDDPEPEPDPTGTDGGGGGGAPDEGEGADPKGFEAHRARQAGERAGADTGPRLVRAWSEEDLVEKDAAWRDHLRACANQFSVRESFDKRAGAFAVEGVKAARELATVQELESRGVAAPSEFLHTPREERGRARPRREGRSWAEYQRTG